MEYEEVEAILAQVTARVARVIDIVRLIHADSIHGEPLPAPMSTNLKARLRLANDDLVATMAEAKKRILEWLS